jgi:hypothetical protein
LHSAIGYVAPKAKLEGRDKQIFKERDQKLEVVIEARKQKRRSENQHPMPCQIPSTGETFNPLIQQG